MLKHIFTQGLFESPYCSNFKPRFLILSACLITCSNSENAAGFAPSLTFDSSSVTLALLGFECLIRYNDIPTLEQNACWSSADFFHYPQKTWPLNIFAYWAFYDYASFELITELLFQALFLSKENPTLQDKQSCTPSMTFNTNSLPSTHTNILSC